MELKVWQQRMLFAVVVVGLAVLGVTLVIPKLQHSGGVSATASPSASASATTAPAQSSPVATQTPAAVTTPSTVNIYSWLPFTQAELANAAGVVTSFCSAYNTYRYTDSATVYIGRMNGIVTSSLAGLLRSDYDTAGVASQRTTQRQVSSGSGTIGSIRAFGSSSITFVVTMAQRMVSTKGTQTASGQYTITVQSVGATWQVNDIELASAGNA